MIALQVSKSPGHRFPGGFYPNLGISGSYLRMAPQSSDCLTFIHNLKPSDPSIFFRTPHPIGRTRLSETQSRWIPKASKRAVKDEVKKSKYLKRNKTPRLRMMFAVRKIFAFFLFVRQASFLSAVRSQSCTQWTISTMTGTSSSTIRRRTSLPLQ